MSRYLVLGCRPWNALAVDALRADHPEHEWVRHIMDWPSIFHAGPYDGAFVLHWPRRLTPDDLAQAPWWVGFHLGRLPQHRGGSPLQNLVARGYETAPLNALRLDLSDEIDGGPIILAHEVSLLGGAEEVYLRVDRGAVDIIGLILGAPRLLDEAEPQDADKYDGWPCDEPFVRRTPAQSRLPAGLHLSGVHNHVRMLDAEGYPRAFVEVDGYRIEFARSALRHGAVECDARITRI